jgi:hypothetical protein
MFLRSAHPVNVGPDMAVCPKEHAILLVRRAPACRSNLIGTSPFLKLYIIFR